MMCSALRSASAAIVSDGFAVTVLPGIKAPSTTYSPGCPVTRPYLSVATPNTGHNYLILESRQTRLISCCLKSCPPGRVQRLAHQLAPVNARGGMFAQLCEDVNRQILV